MQNNCRSCRHHTKETRERIVGQDEFSDDAGACWVHDGSPEDIAKYGPEQFEDVFSCMKQGAVTVGVGDAAGQGCSLWEAGQKGIVSPRLQAILDRLDARPERQGA